jgi:hypothetical protein
MVVQPAASRYTDYATAAFAYAPYFPNSRAEKLGGKKNL